MLPNPGTFAAKAPSFDHIGLMEVPGILSAFISRQVLGQFIFGIVFFFTFLTIQYDCLFIGVVLCYRLVSFGTNMRTSVLSPSKLFMAAFCTLN